MGDRTEKEEEEFLKRHAGSIKVCPERLLDHLRSMGFLLLLAERPNGMNQIEFLRECPALDNMFDVIQLKSNIAGEWISVGWGTSIFPNFRAACSGNHTLKYKADTTSEARNAEADIAERTFSLLNGIHDSFSKTIFEESRESCAAVVSYLRQIEMTDNLEQSLDTLRSRATDEQLETAARYLRREPFHVTNMSRGSVVWNIYRLAQVLFWDGNPAIFNNDRLVAARDNNEEGRRMRLLASRIGREPGWPVNDPFVPARLDDIEDRTPWRDKKLGRVADAIDHYLETTERSCDCGKPLGYVRHKQFQEQLNILARCTVGHEDNISLDLAQMGNI